uniref:exodeoxyribonuclease III n=1 Tax=Oryzias latipes TaxID=8090 RepID=A0A3P9KVG1_ORYLA
MCSLSIASLNVNGLTTPKKRGIILQKLRKENIQLALLQKTHLNDQEHEKLKKLGFRNTYYSSYKQGRKRGVAILFSNKTNFETDKVIKGKDGQYIIVKGRMGDAVLTIVNVYAPPESDKQFFKSLFNVIAVEAEGILICGGDFNVSLNFGLDTTSVHKHKKTVTKFVKISIEELGLIDVWRILNPHKKDYTHYSASHKVHSRIDYFFISKSDIGRVEECKIEGAYVSDHNILHMKINILNRKKQTTWRLNVGILNTEANIKDIKTDIKQYLEENDNGAVDPTVLWDTLKAVMRGKLIFACSPHACMAFSRHSGFLPQSKNTLHRLIDYPTLSLAVNVCVCYSVALKHTSNLFRVNPNSSWVGSSNSEYPERYSEDG